MTEVDRKGFSFNLIYQNLYELREAAAPEPLLMLPAPRDDGATQPDGRACPPEKDGDHPASFAPRPAEERAEEFLDEWVRRFSRA
jgi:hypothetical protein